MSSEEEFTETVQNNVGEVHLKFPEREGDTVYSGRLLLEGRNQDTGEIFGLRVLFLKSHLVVRTAYYGKERDDVRDIGCDTPDFMVEYGPENTEVMDRKIQPEFEIVGVDDE